MDRPIIPNRITRMRAGESTYTDLSDIQIQWLIDFLKEEGYDFDKQPWDGGVFLHCTRSPNRVSKVHPES